MKRGHRGHSEHRVLRGVSKHCRSGKYEAHVWDATLSRTRAYVYAGSFHAIEAAVFARDVAELKLKGDAAELHAPRTAYAHLLPFIKACDFRTLVCLLKDGSLLRECERSCAGAGDELCDGDPRVDSGATLL